MKKFISSSRPKQSGVFHPTYEYRNVTKEIDGSIVTCVERVEIDPLKVNDGLSSNDFSLDVLIRNGSTDLLCETSAIKQSPITVLNTINNL